MTYPSDFRKLPEAVNDINYALGGAAGRGQRIFRKALVDGDLLSYLIDEDSGQFLIISAEIWEFQSSWGSAFNPGRLEIEVLPGIPLDQMASKNPLVEGMARFDVGIVSGTPFVSAIGLSEWLNRYIPKVWLPKMGHNPPQKQRGRSFKTQDSTILEKMRDAILRGDAKNPNDAALMFTDTAIGNGTLDSKRKRLAGKYKREFR